MPDILRVKRRAVGGAAGAPASLAAAEIAFNEQDNVLYYGGGNSAGLATSIFSIAGPGAFLRLSGGTLVGPVGGVAPDTTLDLNFLTGVLDPRLTFTRASTATYFDSSGVMQTAALNVWLWSADASNAAWTRAGTAPVVTGNNVIAPDGTLTAARVAFGPNGYTAMQQAPTMTVNAYTLSIWLRGNVGGEHLWLMATPSGASYYSVPVTLTTSWQRFTFTTPSLTAAQWFWQIGIDTRDPLQTIQAAQTVYMWGGQLELGSIATPYIPTTTVANGAPRFDYDPVTHAPRGLLIEEQRTNASFPSMNWFANATPTNSIDGIIQNIGPDPMGGNAAMAFIPGSFNGAHQYYTIQAGAPSTTYTFSFYAKAAGMSYLYMELGNNGFGANIATATFNLTTGLIVNGVGTISKAASGWYRCSVTATTPASATPPYVANVRVSYDASTTALGNNVDGIWVWGHQYEIGAWPTSYIPTTAAAVTRSADACSMPVGSWFDQTKGSLAHEYILQGTSLSYGASAQFVGVDYNTEFICADQMGASGQPTNPGLGGAAVAAISGAQARQYQVGLSIPAGPVHRVAMSWALGTDVHAAFDGGGEDWSTGILTAMPVITRLSILGPMHYQNPMSAWTRRFRYWQRALSISELQQVASATQASIVNIPIDQSPIGMTTPSSGAFTTLSASGAVSGAGFTALHASPGPIGSTTPSTGAFTTLSATGAVSGAGFTTLLQSVASSTTPLMNGTAAVGTGTTWARADHVHPSDTTRLALAGGTMTGALNVNASVGAWGGFNYGKQVIVTGGGTNPAIGIGDNTAANYVAIVNSGGTMRLEKMPLLSDSSTAPATMMILTGTGNTSVQPFTFNSTSTHTGAATFNGTVALNAAASYTATGSTTARSLQTRGAEMFNVKDWGAIGNNVADDTTAIQACMDAAAAAGGGTVLFPIGNYKISATLNIGNGTTTTASTKAGIVLVGLGANPTTGIWGGFTLTGSVQLIWAGGAANMISVNGPLQGWGVQNIALLGQSVATRGILVTSAMFGDCRNLYITGAITAGIGSTTVATTGTLTETDSIHNGWRGITVMMPNVANAIGVVLTGVGPAFTSNTCFNVFEDLLVGLPATVACWGIYLQNADTNTFINAHIAGGSATAWGVVFDYGFVTGQIMPGGNSFFGIETNGTVLGAHQFGNSGTPSVNARPNYIRGLNQANGGSNPVLANLLPDLPVVSCPTVFLVAQTGAITGTTLVQPFADGTYRISLYLGIQAVGNNVTVTASVGWNDGSARTFSTAAINMSTGSNNPQATTITVIHIANFGLSYSTSISGALGTGQYKLAVVCERLS